MTNKHTPTEKIENNTNLIFTEIKRGGSNAKIYELTAAEFIAIVKNKDDDGELNVGVEPILNADGEIEDFTGDKFYDLPVEEQIDMCLISEGNRFATTITYKIA